MPLAAILANLALVPARSGGGGHRAPPVVLPAIRLQARLHLVVVVRVRVVRLLGGAQADEDELVLLALVRYLFDG